MSSIPTPDEAKDLPNEQELKIEEECEKIRQNMMKYMARYTAGKIGVSNLDASSGARKKIEDELTALGWKHKPTSSGWEIWEESDEEKSDEEKLL